MTQKEREEIEEEAAMDILSFMQKHELEDEEMGSLICAILGLADNEDFVEFCGGWTRIWFDESHKGYSEGGT